MLKDLPSLDKMPRLDVSQVKKKWSDVVRLVHQSGSVAVTNHEAVEMVLLDAASYQQLVEKVVKLNAREQAVLDDLSDRVNARLAVLRQPDAGRKAQALLTSKGKLSKRFRPKAGTSSWK